MTFGTVVWIVGAIAAALYVAHEVNRWWICNHPPNSDELPASPMRFRLTPRPDRE